MPQIGDTDNVFDPTSTTPRQPRPQPANPISIYTPQPPLSTTPTQPPVRIPSPVFKDPTVRDEWAKSQTDDLIKQRIGTAAWQANPQFWQQNPLMAATVLHSSLPEDFIRKIPAWWTPTNNWINGTFSFAGQSGALTQAYLRALNMGDPEARQKALGMLDNLRNMPLGEQQAFASYLAGQVGRTTIPNIQNAGGELLGNQASLTPGLTPGGGSQLQGAFSPDNVKTLETLFPSLAGKIDVTSGGQSLMQSVSDSLGNAGSEISAWISQAQHAPSNFMTLAHEQGVGKTLEQTATAGLAGGLQAVTLPITLGGKGIAAAYDTTLGSHVIRGALGSVPGGQAVAAGLSGPPEVVSALTRAGQTFLTDAAGTAGTLATVTFWRNLLEHPVSTAEGRNQELEQELHDPTTRNWSMAIGNVILAVALHEATTAGGAFKEAGSLPDESLVVGRDAEGNISPGQSLRDSWESSTTGQKVFHPIQTMIDPVVRARVLEGLARSTQDMLDQVNELGPDAGKGSFVYTPKFRKFFDAVDDIRNDPSIANKVGAAYDQGLGFGMKDGLMQKLMNTTRSDMGRVWLEAANGVDNEALKAAQIEFQRTAREVTALATREAHIDHPMVLDPSMDQIGDLASDPNYKYHITSRSDAPSLAETDIQPRNIFSGLTKAQREIAQEFNLDDEAQRQANEQQLPRAFVADTGDQALRYAGGGDRVLFRVPNEDLPQDLHPDTAPNTEGSHYSTDPIKTENAEYLGEDGQWHKASDLKPSDPEGYQVAKMQYEAAKAAVVDAATPSSNRQIFFPGANYNDFSNFLHRSLAGRPNGVLQNVTADLLSPVRTLERWSNKVFGTDINVAPGAYVLKFTDKLASRPYLYNPASENFGPTQADANATTIQRVGRVLGMSKDDIDAVTQNFVNSTADREAVHNALVDFADRRSKYGRPDMSSWTKTQIGRAYHGDLFEGYNTVDVEVAPGVWVTQPVRLGDTVGKTATSRPFLPSEFLNQNELYLPDLETLRSANSWMRGWEDAAGRSKRFTAKTLGGLNFGLNIVGRSTMLPLWAAFKLPALVFKHALNAAAVDYATPGMVGVRGIPENVAGFDAFTHFDPAVIGSVNEGITDTPLEANVPLQTASFIKQGRLTSEGAGALLDKMRYYNQDPLSRALLRNNLDVDATLAQMGQGGDVLLGRHNEMNLKGSGLTDSAELRTTLERQAQAISQASLGNPDLLDFMRTGQVRLPRKGSEPAQWEQDIQHINDRLGEMDRHGDAAAVATLQGELARKMEEVYAPDSGVPMDVAHFEDERLLAQELQDRFDGNQLDLPKQIMVKRVGRSVYKDANGELHYEGGSMLDQARDLEKSASRLAYRVFQPVGWADRTFGRTHFFAQRASYWYDTFRQGGMDVARAEAEATLKASVETKDVFYDISTRSPLERSVRSTFWFAPAAGELMYQAFYRIPAMQGNALLGNIIDLAKLDNYLSLAKEVGVVQKDSQGRDVIPLPGLSRALSYVTHGKWAFTPNEKLDVPLASFDPLVTQPVPTMGPLPAKVVTTLAKHIPALKGIANAVAPYGSDATLLPYTMRRVAAAMGIKVPDMLSNDAVDEQWNRNRILGVQMALEDAKTNNPEPTLEQFHLDANAAGYVGPTDPNHQAWFDKYQAAHRQWVTGIWSEGQHIAMGIAGAQNIFGGILPGNAQVSTPMRDDWLNFIKSQTNVDLSTPAGLAAWESAKATFIQAHPNAMPYSISAGLYDVDKGAVPPGKTPTELYAEGIKNTMNARDYVDFSSAMQSKWLYNAQVYGDTLGSGQNATDILKNWHEHQVAITNRDKNWQQYLNLNPDADSIITKHDAAVAVAYPGYSTRNDESTWLKQTMTGLNSVSNLFTGQGGVTTSEYSTVLGTLKAANATLRDSLASKGVAADQKTSDLNWYFSNVISSYMNATKPIWDKITQARDAGAPTSVLSQLYGQLDQVNQQYSSKSLLNHNGQSFPSPDEYFYDAKSRAQQAIAVVHWASEPASFLSAFQRQKVGYPTFQGEDQMWAQVAANDEKFGNVLNLLSPSSNAYQSTKAGMQAFDQAISARYGQAGLNTYLLSQQPAYVRTRSLGTFKNDPVMAKAFQYADLINTTLAGDRASGSTGYSQSIVNMKIAFYDWIQKQTDPTFKHNMNLLSLSSTSGPKGDHPYGVYLYEDYFFSTPYYYVNPELRALVGAA